MKVNLLFGYSFVATERSVYDTRFTILVYGIFKESVRSLQDKCTGNSLLTHRTENGDSVIQRCLEPLVMINDLLRILLNTAKFQRLSL